MSEQIYSKLDVGSKKTSPEVNAGATRQFSLRIGKIVEVNSKKNTVSITWLDDRKGGFSNLDIGASYFGFRSGIRFAPEINSVIVVGYAGKRTVPLAYLSPTQFENLLAGLPEKEGNPKTFARILQSGEIDIYSAKAAELFLTDQVLLQDGKSNKILIDPTQSTIFLDSLNTEIKNEAGTLYMGQVYRSMPGLEARKITNDGLPATSFLGGNALNELRIQIKEKSDSTNFVENATQEPIAEVVLGTVVNEFGLKNINSLGNEIVCRINFKSGSKIDIDKEGNININDGKMTSPLETITAAAKVALKTATGLVEPPLTITNPLQCQQRAAREGDTISIPLTPAAGALNAIEHPNQLKISSENMATMFQVAPSILTILGPCLAFIPAAPMTLKGEIVEGAKGTFIGDKPESLF